MPVKRFLFTNLLFLQKIQIYRHAVLFYRIILTCFGW